MSAYASIDEDGVAGENLAAALTSSDPEERCLAIKALEVCSRKRPQTVPAFAVQLLALLAADEPWVVRMHVARVLPYAGLQGEGYESALCFLFREAEAPNRFVSAWALNSLAILSGDDESIRGKTMFLLEEAIEIGSPAQRARAKRALATLRKEASAELRDNPDKFRAARRQRG